MSGEVLAPLNDAEHFALVAVDAESGTISWPDGLDLAPEPLYEATLRNPTAATA